MCQVFGVVCVSVACDRMRECIHVCGERLCVLCVLCGERARERVMTSRAASERMERPIGAGKGSLR